MKIDFHKLKFIKFGIVNIFWVSRDYVFFYWIIINVTYDTS